MGQFERKADYAELPGAARRQVRVSSLSAACVLREYLVVPKLCVRFRNFVFASETLWTTEKRVILMSVTHVH